VFCADASLTGSLNSTLIMAAFDTDTDTSRGGVVSASVVAEACELFADSRPAPFTALTS